MLTRSLFKELLGDGDVRLPQDTVEVPSGKDAKTDTGGYETTRGLPSFRQTARDAIERVLQGEAEQRYTGTDEDERHRGFIFRFSQSGLLRLKIGEDLRQCSAPDTFVSEGSMFPL